MTFEKRVSDRSRRKKRRPVICVCITFLVRAARLSTDRCPAGRFYANLKEPPGGRWSDIIIKKVLQQKDAIQTAAAAIERQCVAGFIIVGILRDYWVGLDLT